MASASPSISGRYPCSTLPPLPVASKKLDGDKLGAFNELWHRSEQDYSGELYDLLDDKVRRMLCLCCKLDIQPSQFHATFSMILTGEAQLFYIDYVQHGETFATTYKKFKDHFEVNHRNYYHCVWTTTSFEECRKEYRAKHRGPEDLLKVLGFMLDRLNICQRALGPGYAGDVHLKLAVLWACRGVPEFHHAYFNAIGSPDQTSDELIYSLRLCLCPVALTRY